MSVSTVYSESPKQGNYSIEIIGEEEVAAALGDLKSKTPAAIKVAVNATWREARKLMIARAKARYAVNAAGAKHLKDLAPRKKATNSKPYAILYIASMRNDLGYFDYAPKGVHTGVDVFRNAPPLVKARVLKASQRKPLTGEAHLSKGFVLEFKSGHVGMVQRVIGSSSKNVKTRNGYERWRNREGKVEKTQTMGSPSATAMHRTIWPEVRPDVEEFLIKRLDQQVQKVIERAARKAKAKK